MRLVSCCCRPRLWLYWSGEKRGESGGGRPSDIVPRGNLRANCLAAVQKRLVGSVRVLRPLQLDLQTLHADLETVHRLDGCLRARRVVEGDET